MTAGDEELGGTMVSGSPPVEPTSGAEEGGATGCTGVDVGRTLVEGGFPETASVVESCGGTIGTSVALDWTGIGGCGVYVVVDGSGAGSFVSELGRLEDTEIESASEVTSRPVVLGNDDG